LSLNEGVLRKFAQWRESPLLFAKECMHFTPKDEQQVALINSIKDNNRVTVRSGHGIGKDACVGGVIIPWFLVTHASRVGSGVMSCKVVCTAPTARQLYDVLLSEIAKWMMHSAIADEFVVQKDKIFHKDYPKTWWLRAITTSTKQSKEEQAEALAGLHDEHLLVVVDEASGVPDPVFIPLEGALTLEDNRCILIGNMTKNSGYFYDTHFHPVIAKQWKKLHFSSKNSKNVKPDYCEYMATKYGITSNVYRIRVEGEPPLEDEKTFISLAWAEQCIGRDIKVAEDEPVYLGVDVARYGEDESVILPRKGNIILPWETFQGINTITLGGFVMVQYQEMEAQGLAVDEIGVGAGVVDWLYKHNMRQCFGVNVANASSDITKFDRLRDELWTRVREKLIAGAYSFPDVILPGESLSMGRELANELASPWYDFNAHGGFKIESKKQMKGRGIASPNIADALCLSEYFSNISTKVWGGKKKGDTKNDRSRRNRYGQQSSNSLSWMAV